MSGGGAEHGGHEAVRGLSRIAKGITTVPTGLFAAIKDIAGGTVELIEDILGGIFSRSSAPIHVDHLPGEAANDNTHKDEHKTDDHHKKDEHPKAEVPHDGHGEHKKAAGAEHH